MSRKNRYAEALRRALPLSPEVGQTHKMSKNAPELIRAKLLRRDLELINRALAALEALAESRGLIHRSYIASRKTSTAKTLAGRTYRATV